MAGFLAAIAVRSRGLLPTATLGHITTLQNVSLAAALVGLGTGVDIGNLRKVGARPLVLGLASWVIVATVAH